MNNARSWLVAVTRVLVISALPWHVSVVAAEPAAVARQPEPTMARVVYHVDDASRAVSALRNVANHLKAAPNTKIVVVALGKGIDFLLKDAKDDRNNPYEPMLDDLALIGVEFRICNNTLVGRDIRASQIYPEAKIVPSGVAEIARLQLAEGYAYIKP